jgi:hypothetical protein
MNMHLKYIFVSPDEGLLIINSFVCCGFALLQSEKHHCLSRSLYLVRGKRVLRPVFNNMSLPLGVKFGPSGALGPQGKTLIPRGSAQPFVHPQVVQKNGGVKQRILTPREELHPWGTHSALRGKIKNGPSASHAPFYI